MRRKTQVAVTLTDDELALLRRIPADSDAARLRALLHKEAVGEAIADAVVSRLQSRFNALLAGQRAINRDAVRDVAEAQKRAAGGTKARVE